MKKIFFLILTTLISYNIAAEEIIIEVPKDSFNNYSFKLIPTDSISEPRIQQKKQNTTINLDLSDFWDRNHFFNNINNIERNIQNQIEFMNKRFEMQNQYFNNLLNQNKHNIKKNTHSSSYKLNLGSNVSIDGKINFSGHNDITIPSNTNIGKNVSIIDIGSCEIKKDIPENSKLTIENKKEYCN